MGRFDRFQVGLLGRAFSVSPAKDPDALEAFAAGIESVADAISAEANVHDAIGDDGLAQAGARAADTAAGEAARFRKTAWLRRQ